jgi:hypothetical protein
LSFVERSVLLYFCFIIAQKAEDLANEEFGLAVTPAAGAEKTSKWTEYLLAKRKYFSYKLGFFNPVRIVAMTISLILSFVGIIDLLIFYKDSVTLNWWSMECQRGALGGFKPVLICIYFVAILRVYVTIKIRKSKENFGIQTELKLMSLTIAGIAGYLTYAIFWTDQAMATLSDFVLISYLPFAVILPQIAIFISFGLVLVHINTIINKRKRARSVSDLSQSQIMTVAAIQEDEAGSKSGTVSKTRTASVGVASVQFKLLPAFQRVLEDPELCSLFQQFLTKEWSVENILFWRAVKSMNAHVGLSLMKAESTPNRIEDDVGAEAEALMNFEVKWNFGRKIFKEFCLPDSRLSVNIPHTHRVRLQALFNREDSSITDEQKPHLLEELQDALRASQREIMSLMQNDSFKRFKNTPEYLAAIKSDA